MKNRLAQREDREYLKPTLIKKNSKDCCAQVVTPPDVKLASSSVNVDVINKVKAIYSGKN